MERIRIKKVGSLSIFKSLISVFGLSGIVIGIFTALTAMPAKQTLSINGKIIKTEAIPDFGATFIGTVLGTFMYFIGIAILITFITILFNFFCKLTGGIIVYTEKD